MSLRAGDESAQAAVEHVGLVLLVAAALTALTAAGVAGLGVNPAGALVNRFLCAVRLAEACSPPAAELQAAYGTELATLLRRHAPEIRFEEGPWASLPVDFRSCRDRACADTSERGALGRSFRDHPATAFVHVIDCREPAGEVAYRCDGSRAGRIYLQYWLYYPDSATRAFGRSGYHPDDWEGFQVRVGRDGTVEARASSHGSWNHGGGLGGAISDAGRKRIGPLTVDTRRSGWGPSNGYLWVSEGSHAGRVAGGDRFSRAVPARKLRLVAIEPQLEDLDAHVFEPGIAPPWRKPVWLDPEHTGT